MRTKVLFDRVKKELRRLPIHIQEKAEKWALDVEEYGLEKVRQLPGLHDEPLKGNRLGQRSIRLSKSYRLIYVVFEETIIVVTVLEIHKHDY